MLSLGNVCSQGDALGVASAATDPAPVAVSLALVLTVALLDAPVLVGGLDDVGLVGLLVADGFFEAECGTDEAVAGVLLGVNVGVGVGTCLGARVLGDGVATSGVTVAGRTIK